MPNPNVLPVPVGAIAYLVIKFIGFDSYLTIGNGRHDIGKQNRLPDAVSPESLSYYSSTENAYFASIA